MIYFDGANGPCIWIEVRRKRYSGIKSDGDQILCFTRMDQFIERGKITRDTFRFVLRGIFKNFPPQDHSPISNRDSPRFGLKVSAKKCGAGPF